MRLSSASVSWHLPLVAERVRNVTCRQKGWKDLIDTVWHGLVTARHGQSWRIVLTVAPWHVKEEDSVDLSNGNSFGAESLAASAARNMEPWIWRLMKGIQDP